MSAKILPFTIPNHQPEPDRQPPNESCYYSNAELHEILQDLIDSGHKYLVEVKLIACRDYWARRDS